MNWNIVIDIYDHLYEVSDEVYNSAADAWANGRKCVTFLSDNKIVVLNLSEQIFAQ